MIYKADRVLVDAPCSGLGVTRRKPEIKYKAFSEDMALLPKEQGAHFSSASSHYVKPGGRLVYSTCTINPAENEKVTDTFLKKHPEFVKVERTLLLPNVNGTDGFFICVDGQKSKHPVGFGKSVERTERAETRWYRSDSNVTRE